MHQKISIEDLAQRFYLSRPYIRNLFVKYENMSPKQYLQKIRMERAAEMLLQTRYDVSLIAQSVGYSDQFTFSKMFKQHHGVSPAGFRRENGW
ncbi:MAG: helix-turn-helix transcriptional regulator [Clostridia bacterium]|nr:helix-turn-helix transcriptional regulator [Clostridia bacterium]